MTATPPTVPDLSSIRVGWNRVTERITATGPDHGPSSVHVVAFPEGAEPTIAEIIEALRYPGRDLVSGACQSGRHDECSPLIVTASRRRQIACGCRRHADVSAYCWGDIRRVEVRP